MSDSRTEPAPAYVGVAGDWHGSASWARSAIYTMCRRLGQLDPDGPKIILHAGDFGIWPGIGGHNFTGTVNGTLKDCGAHLWFADGNHEDHTRLWEWQIPDTAAGRAAQWLCWLPRGHRWTWHGRTWLALGGAVSVDKACRTEGVDWWPEEEITQGQARQVCEAGPADVMLTHDAPAGVPVTYMDPPPTWWAKEDLRRSENHRALLRAVTDQVRPSHLIHGHYHQGGPAWLDVQLDGRETRVASLNRDGAPGNYGVLDVRTMEWVEVGR